MFQKLFLSYQSCSNTLVESWQICSASLGSLQVSRRFTRWNLRAKVRLDQSLVIASLCFHADVLRVQMFYKLFYKERGLTLKYPMQLLILFKRYKGSLSTQKSQREVILVVYKTILMLQHSLVGLVSTTQ